MRRTCCLTAILILCLPAAGAAWAMPRADDDPPRERAPGKDDEDGPSLPTALPDGARLPEPAVVKSMRALLG